MSHPVSGCGLLALLAVALFLGPAAAVKPITDWESGFMTHYGGAQDGMDPSSPSFGTSVGSCGYGMIPKDAFPYFSVAAFSPENHYYKSGPSGACGQCFQIQCVNGRNGKDYCKTDAQGQALSILVMISDVCPECEAEHMDVQSLAFGKLADQGLGNINMRYRRVECNIPKNIEVDVMNFGGGGQWLRLAITDTGGYASVQSVSVKSSSGSNWQTMDNTWGAVWESGSAPQAPLDFQITCSDGQIVTADSVVTQDGGISGGVGGAITFTTDVQFNIDDPAASSVQSFDGPEDPMVVTSTTPGNSDSTEGGSSTSSGSATTNSTTSSSSANSTSTTSPAASSSCSDTDAPGGYSCQQQKDWGKCDSELFTSNNYCAETCGRCGASSASSPAASGSSPAASDSSCQDKTPSGGVSCQQRKDWGQCSQSWLSSGGYCQATCGTCGGSSSSSSSDKSSPSPSPSSSSSGSDGSCSDNAPSGGTCAQQKQWGACDQSWMVSGNYCATTCGRCGSSSSSDNSGSSDSGSSSGSSDSSPSPSGSGDSSSSDSSPQVQSYSGPSGRRLLLL